MKLLYIGAGFVGTCNAAVMADSGHDVLVYDVDDKKINMLGSGDREMIEKCLFEAGLSDLLSRYKDKIIFTTDQSRVERELEDTDAVFMCLPTPEKNTEEGETDLSYYNTAAQKLGVALSKRNKGKQTKYIVVINKSTVPINTAGETERILQEAGADNFGVVSNPEFLVEGRAVEGALKPDRIVIGAKSSKDFEIMRQIYRRFCGSPTTQYIEVNPKEAAAGKLLANYLLFSKIISTYEVVGRVAESFDGVEFEKLRQIVSSDTRIGKWGLFDSVYCGGSCFIKDAKSLIRQLKDAGVEAKHIQRMLDGNNFQRDNFYARAKREANFDFQNKTVAIFGVAFKRDTNDIRNSGAIDIVNHLINDEVKEIRVYDPAAMPMFKEMFDLKKDARFEKIKYFESEDDALSGTQACLILTDWPKFRALGEKIKKICQPPYLIMDGRRMLAGQFEELEKLGYDILAVGSPAKVKK